MNAGGRGPRVAPCPALAHSFWALGRPGGAPRRWRPKGGGGGARRELGACPWRALSRGRPSLRHHAFSRSETQTSQAEGLGGDAATTAPFAACLSAAGGLRGRGRRLRGLRGERGGGSAVLRGASGLGRGRCGGGGDGGGRAQPRGGGGAAGARALLEDH